MQCNCASRLNWGKMREREEWKCQVLSKLMWQSFGSSTAIWPLVYRCDWRSPTPPYTQVAYLHCTRDAAGPYSSALLPFRDVQRLLLTNTCLQLNWLGQELIETEYVHSILLKKVPLIQIKDIKTFTSMFLLRNSLIKQLAVPAFEFLNHLCDKSF